MYIYIVLVNIYVYKSHFCTVHFYRMNSIVKQQLHLHNFHVILSVFKVFFVKII